MSKVLWFVNHGPNISHLQDVDVFDRLKDAKEFIKKMPLSPSGIKRSFKVSRHKYLHSEVYGDIVNVKSVVI